MTRIPGVIPRLRRVRTRPHPVPLPVDHASRESTTSNADSREARSEGEGTLWQLPLIMEGVGPLLPLLHFGAREGTLLLPLPHFGGEGWG
jgi:hypothetical protein